MITREEALKFLNEKIENKNIIKHMLATEALMGELANYFIDKGKIKVKDERARAELVEAGYREQCEVQGFVDGQQRVAGDLGDRTGVS